MAPLAGARERRGRDWITHSARIEAEIFELRSPVRVGITQALDVDAAREAAFNRCLDELGSKERERERQIDLTHRAAFALCQLPGVLPVVCVETRHIDAVLRTRISETDRKDAVPVRFQWLGKVVSLTFFILWSFHRRLGRRLGEPLRGRGVTIPLHRS